MGDRRHFFLVFFGIGIGLVMLPEDSFTVSGANGRCGPALQADLADDDLLAAAVAKA